MTVNICKCVSFHWVRSCLVYFPFYLSLWGFCFLLLFLPALTFEAIALCNWRQHLMSIAIRVLYAANTHPSLRKTQILEVLPHPDPVIRQNTGAEEGSESRTGLPCGRSMVSDPQNILPLTLHLLLSLKKCPMIRYQLSSEAAKRLGECVKVHIPCPQF